MIGINQNQQLEFDIQLLMQVNFHSRLNKQGSFITIGCYHYKESDKLGSGYESIVYKALHATKKVEVALKIIQPEKVGEGIHKTLLDSQLRCLEALKGTPYVVNMLQIIKTQREIFIVTELCKGDLGSRKQKRLPEKQAWSYIKQMIEGYKYLYKKGIVHRDLKPDNMFLKEIGQIKIGDFGFAGTIQEVKLQSNYSIGSPSYMAPEVLQRNQYSHASDIWAIGVSFYELLTGNVPWICDTQQEITSQVTKESIEQKINKLRASQAAKSFLRKTLCYESYYRIKPQQLFEYDLTYSTLNKTQNIYINYKEDSQSVTTAQTPKLNSNRLKEFKSIKHSQSKSQFDFLVDDILPKIPQTTRNLKPNEKQQRRMSFDLSLYNNYKPQQNYKLNQQPNVENEKRLRDHVSPTAFKKKIRTSLDAGHIYESCNDLNKYTEQSIDKIMNGYIQCSKYLFKFMENFNKIKADKRWESEMNVLKVCLKNFITKTMEKIGSLDKSDILKLVLSEEQIRKYLRSQHYLKTKLIHQDALLIFEQNDEINKHWKIAREQKPKAIANAGLSFLKTVKPMLQKQKNQQLLQMSQYVCQIVQMFNNLHKNKYLTSEVTSKILRTRKRTTNFQALMNKIQQVEKFK